MGGGLKIDGRGWVGRLYPSNLPTKWWCWVCSRFLLSRCHHLKGLSSGEHAEEGRDLKCPLAQARASSLLTCAHQLQNYPVSPKPCMLSDSFACIDSPSPHYYQFLCEWLVASSGASYPCTTRALCTNAGWNPMHVITDCIHL